MGKSKVVAKQTSRLVEKALFTRSQDRVAACAWETGKESFTQADTRCDCRSMSNPE